MKNNIEIALSSNCIDVLPSLVLFYRFKNRQRTDEFLRKAPGFEGVSKLCDIICHSGAKPGFVVASSVELIYRETGFFCGRRSHEAL